MGKDIFQINEYGTGNKRFFTVKVNLFLKESESVVSGHPMHLYLASHNEDLSELNKTGYLILKEGYLTREGNLLKACLDKIVEITPRIKSSWWQRN